jgi:hypothetical protein
MEVGDIVKYKNDFLEKMKNMKIAETSPIISSIISESDKLFKVEEVVNDGRHAVVSYVDGGTPKNKHIRVDCLEIVPPTAPAGPLAVATAPPAAAAPAAEEEDKHEATVLTPLKVNDIVQIDEFSNSYGHLKKKEKFGEVIGITGGSARKSRTLTVLWNIKGVGKEMKMKDIDLKKVDVPSGLGPLVGLELGSNYGGGKRRRKSKKKKKSKKRKYKRRSKKSKTRRKR